MLITQEIGEFFGALCQEPGAKTKYVYFLFCHSSPINLLTKNSYNFQNAPRICTYLEPLAYSEDHQKEHTHAHRALISFLVIESNINEPLKIHRHLKNILKVKNKDENRVLERENRKLRREDIYQTNDL